MSSENHFFFHDKDGNRMDAPYVAEDGQILPKMIENFRLVTPPVGRGRAYYLHQDFAPWPIEEQDS